MGSPIVTLTTDWGESSFFAGMVKGRLYSTIPDVRVVDITHGLKKYDLIAASFVVKNGCKDFPQGTVHIVDVLSEEKEGQGFVVVQSNGQYYVCTNNGLPNILFGEERGKVVEIEPYWASSAYNFAAYDVFCPVAAKIVNGTPIEELGKVVDLSGAMLPTYMVMGNIVKTHVRHIDSYGNVYLNITYDELMGHLKGRTFSINVRGTKINDIKVAYSECKPDIALTISSTGYMEAAVYEASAADMMGVKIGDIFDININ